MSNLAPAQLLNEAKALEAKGQIGDARKIYQRLTNTFPKLPEPLYRLGLIAMAAGERHEAAQAFKKVAALSPNFPQVFYNLGLIAQEENQFQHAIRHYENAIKLKPDYLSALNNLGSLLQRTGQYTQAITVLQQAATLAPNDANIRNNLGNTFRLLERFDEALIELQQAALLMPGSATFHSNLSTGFRDLGRLDEAEVEINAALSIDSNLAEAHNNLGGLKQQLGELDAALVALHNATELKPDYVEAWVNLAGVYLVQFNSKAAEEMCQCALVINPQSSEALHHLAVIADRRDQYDLANDFLQRAIAAKPDNAEAHGAVAALALAHGDFDRAWQAYAWRSSRKASINGIPPRGGPAALLPAQLSGKIYLLHAEQGLGDILFFLRWAPLLAERRATLWFSGDPRLYSMLQRSGLFAGFVSDDNPAPPSAESILIGDLPYALQVPITLPLRLTADEKLHDSIKQQLATAGPPPYLAVTWQGGVRPYTLKHKNRLTFFKTVSLSALGEVLKAWPGTLLSVQRLPDKDEMAELSLSTGKNIADFSHFNDDLEAMLALLDKAERYVSVSNTNVYLRLALGKEADMLIPHPPEWRWMRSGDSSPWYPGFRVLRETGEGWDSAMNKLAQSLSENPWGKGI